MFGELSFGSAVRLQHYIMIYMEHLSVLSKDFEYYYPDYIAPAIVVMNSRNISYQGTHLLHQG